MKKKLSKKRKVTLSVDEVVKIAKTIIELAQRSAPTNQTNL